jgi:hypothetical protein
MLQEDSWDAWKHRFHALVMEELSSAWQGLYKGIMDIALWFLKLWPIMSSGIGMLSLAWLDLTMTST